MCKVNANLNSATIFEIHADPWKKKDSFCGYAKSKGFLPNSFYSRDNPNGY